jgi:hypothetical protein
MPSGGSSVLGLTTEPSRGVSRTLARAAAGCRVTELSLQVLVELVIEGAPRWQTGEDGRWASGAGRPARRVSIPRTVDHSGAPAPRVTKDVLTYWLEVPPLDDSACGRGRSFAVGRARMHRRGQVAAARPGRRGRLPGHQHAARPAGCHRGPAGRGALEASRQDPGIRPPTLAAELHQRRPAQRTVRQHS